MNFMLKIWARLTGQKVVYLRDHDGEINVSLSYKTPFGWVAKRFGKNVFLVPDGTAECVSYVEEWKEIREF